MPEQTYRVAFKDSEDGKTVTLRCRHVADSPLGIGFLCLSGFVFESEGRVVNPLEDQLRSRYQDVERLHLNLYRILSIEERGPQGELKLGSDREERSNVVVLRPPSDADDR